MNFKNFTPFGKIWVSVNDFPRVKISWESMKPVQSDGLASYEIVASPSPLRQSSPYRTYILPCGILLFCSLSHTLSASYPRLFLTSFLLSAIMVYNIEQAFNIPNDSTYVPQMTLSNGTAYPSVSSAYYATYSDPSFGYNDGMYYPQKISSQSMNVSANVNGISNFYDEPTQFDPSSPMSSHNSFNGSTSSLSSSPPTKPSYYYQNQNHLIHEIQVSQSVIEAYVSRPTIDDLRSGWRPDFLKCNYPDCPSRAIDASRLHSHLALHLNSRKAYGCSCGTTFGRLSEANRHLYDQSPCEVCGDSRRKQKGTNTCSRCYIASARLR